MSSFKDWLIALTITLISIILTGSAVLFFTDQTEAMDKRIKERAVMRENIAEEVEKHSPLSKSEFMSIHDDILKLTAKVDTLTLEFKDLRDMKVSDAEPK